MKWNNKMRCALVVILFCTSVLSLASVPRKDINPVLLKERWPAYWITHPEASLTDYGVFHFRRNFDLPVVPQKFIVHVSADNRYKLYVNGHEVSKGPARGDLLHWRFETIDFVPFLKTGRNTVAAVVWNFGEMSPWAQITSKTAFLLQGDSEKESVINTDESWAVLQDTAYRPLTTRSRYLNVVGPGEIVDARLYPWGWCDPDFDDDDWLKPRQLFRAVPYGGRRYSCPWTLVPRRIPPMEEYLQRIPRIARSTLDSINDGFLNGQKALIIPAETNCSILLDQTFLTNSYIHLIVSGGENAEVAVTVAEALFDENRQKGDRDEITGRTISGMQDKFICDGGDRRHFETLWFRTYRYIQLDINTCDTPLTISDLYGHYTAYPFAEIGLFVCDDPMLERIWDVGWRTQRLCANETYYDCPYYEQLQYAGDTRIQTFITQYVSGDDRLMRRALLDFDRSRFPDGLTQSRYPNRVTQTIPPYSLFWIAMIHDYWMLCGEADFVDGLIPGVDAVLRWFASHVDVSLDMLGPLEWWNFVDWTPEYEQGVPPGVRDGGSAIITLQYVYALDYAVDLFRAFDSPLQAAFYQRLADRLKNGVMRHCWHEEAGLIADSPSKEIYSQHANIMGILTETIPPERQSDVMDHILANRDLVQATFYYRFYLFRALEHMGMADRIVSEMSPWRDMIDMGLTTFAEKPEPTRSDCHAWSACPVYEFLNTVCGIKPASPGFKTVLVEPHLGYLKEIKGTAAHPSGVVRVDLRRKGSKGIEGTVALPQGVTGQFNWNGRIVYLSSGAQKINLD